MYLVDLFLWCLYFTAIVAAVMMIISYVAAKSNCWAAAMVMIGLVVYAYVIGAIILVILSVVDHGLLGGVVVAVSLALQFGVLWKLLARKGK